MSKKNFNKANKKRLFKGTVVSNKMDKTAVVKIDRIKIHPVYKKRYKVSKKYKIHDPKNEAKIGDQVVFEECRPLSKDKRWRLVK
ncbi:MAG: 30S ribosomal protein S17 [Patescibacteria group bacterium]|jgi:small subunit ribosomal protein S17|nr:30S ribosomal protein S17 [Patescibacteria group bacterium]MDD5172920.1 30S ribosomal protein S17 [Patescibacteria group bacterium]